MAILIKKNGNLVSVGESSKVEVDVLANRILPANNNLKYSYENNSITALNDFAFTYDCNLTSFSSTSLTNIVRNTYSVNTPGAFKYCKNLETFNAPNLKTAGPYAFQESSNLTSINIPNLEQGADSMFSGCINLTSLYLPKLDSAYSYMFSACRKLENLTVLLSNGGFYSNYPLWGCNALKNITILRTDQPAILATTNNFPASSSQHITIYVPASLIDSYKAASNWVTLYNNGYIDFQAIS